jgi:serine/threonine-protein kinase
MRLGSSLERKRTPSKKRRGGGARRRRGRRGDPIVPTDLLLWILGVGVGGWLVGYLVATQLFFPAPEPPQDLLGVPDLRGEVEDGARTMVEQAGLALGAVEYLNHPEADSGAVLGQSPLPGQLAFPGDSVRVTLSLGPERRLVPEVSRLRADRGVALLEATGFAVAVDSVESDEPRGRILRVAPAEGEELTLPGEVAIQVSLGPPAVVMPDLLRMAEDQARDTLMALGLEVGEVEEVFRFGRDQGRVVEQDPAAGQELERGSVVRLVVGRRGGDVQDH